MDFSLMPNLEDSERISRSMRVLSYEERAKFQVDKVTPAIQDRRFITAYCRSPKDSRLTLDVCI